jgi:hypothetical protein
MIFLLHKVADVDLAGWLLESELKKWKNPKNLIQSNLGIRAPFPVPRSALISRGVCNKQKKRARTCPPNWLQGNAATCS